MLLAAEQGWVAEVPGPEEPREREKRRERSTHRILPNAAADIYGVNGLVLTMI